MEATRIKWDAGMQKRCLTRLADAYSQPAEEKQVPAKAAESEFTLDFDIPAVTPVESPAVSIKPVQKGSKWEDFKKAIDMAL